MPSSARRITAASFLAAITGVAAGCSGSTDTDSAVSESADTAAAVSIQACPDNDPRCPSGNFAVICKDGGHEVDTVTQIQQGRICSKKQGKGGRGQENCACDPDHEDCDGPDGDGDADDKCRFLSCAEAPDGTPCGAGKTCAAGKCAAGASSTPAEELVGKQIVVTGRCFTASDLCFSSRPPNSGTEFDTNAAKFNVHFEKTASGVVGVLTSIDLPFSAPWFHPTLSRVSMGAPTKEDAQTIQQGEAKIPQTTRFSEFEDLVIQVRKTGSGAPKVVVLFDAHAMPIPAAPSCQLDPVVDFTDASCTAIMD